MIWLKHMLMRFNPCMWMEAIIIATIQSNGKLGLEIDTLEEISTQNGPFNFDSNSMSSCVSQ